MGDVFSKKSPDMKHHVETAIASAGPYPPSRKPCAIHFLARVFSGMFRKKPPSERHGDTLVYANPGVSPDKLLVIAKGKSRARVDNLVCLALSRGWRVAVNEGESTGISVGYCVLHARKLLPSRHTCLIGVAAGARAACKASLAVPLVSIPDGHDTEPEFWVDYAAAPTLIINSREDPYDSIEACDIAAKNYARIATVTTPWRDYDDRWSHSVALEFLDSVIREE